jgi:ribosomal protein S12 methylthiotransferase accessory factor
MIRQDSVLPATRPRGPAEASGPPTAEKEADTLALLLDRILDSETGFLRLLNVPGLQADEPPIYVGMAEFSDFRRLNPRRVQKTQWERAARRKYSSEESPGTRINTSCFSSGAGLTRDTALWATVGEACERYAMHYVAEGASVFSRRDQLGGASIDPNKLILFSDEQYSREHFPYGRVEPGQARYWGTGVDLVTGDPVYLPVELYSAAFSMTENCPALDATYSTGCAAGPNYEKAIYSGLCEVIERDAFMFYWLAKTTPPALSFSALRDFLPAGLLNLADYPHVELSLRWLRSDVDLPCVACFIRPKYAPGFALGAACHPDWRIAVEKAIVESFHTLNWTTDLDRWRSGPMLKDEVRDFPDHVRYYLEPANVESIGFLVAGGEDTDESSAFLSRFAGRSASLSATVGDLDSLGYQPIAVERTGEDLESVGMFAIHVVVPGMQNLHVGLGTEHRDPRRIQRIGAALGIRVPTQLYLEPHPFP